MLRTWLERLVVKLSNRVNTQLDDLADKKAFEAAQDASIAGDFKAALAGFEALAERNHGPAAALAGSMHIAGTGTKVNGAKALKYLEIGKNAGDPAAIALLGMTHAAGYAGVKVDYIKARPFLEAAVKNGDLEAKKMLDLIKGRQKANR